MAVGKDKFDEAKHKRGRPGNKGQFADKPGAGDKPSASASGLKERGISRSDEIIDLRDDEGRSLGTVGAYVDGHSSGIEAAKRTLRREHAAGRIGFRAQEEARATGQGGEPRAPWPWSATARQTPPLDLKINDNVMTPGRLLGLFRDRDEALSFSQTLNAGMPETMGIVTTIMGGGRSRRDAAVYLHTDGEGLSVLSRSFGIDRGRLIASHDFFELDDVYVGGGHGRTMMRASLHLYDRIGVAEIRADAGLSGGGYTWAKYGFAPRGQGEAAALRRRIAERIRDSTRLTDEARQGLTAAMSTAADDDLPFVVATYRDRAGKEWGGHVLLKLSWSAYIDLENPRHRERVSRALR